MEPVCQNCGQPTPGKYCANCGEKVYTAHDKSIRHLFEEAFHFITHLDSKFFRSIALVIKKPGFLSVEFCRGVRKKYFKPVSLFLIGVVIYLLLPFVQGLNLRFDSSIATFNSIGIHVLETAAQKKAAAHHVTMEALGEHYDAKSPKIAKLLLFLVLPLTGLALMFAFPRKDKFYFDHFILGTEINTFFLYVCFILIPLIFTGISKVLYALFKVDVWYTDVAIGPVMTIALLYAYTMAFRRFYQVKISRAILKSVLFLLLHSLIIFIIYRFILYFIILLFI